MFRCSLFLLLPLTLLAQNTTPQEATGSVEGRVTNAQTGDAIAGASLHLYPLFVRGAARPTRLHQPQAATSQADGGFQFEAVPAGTYFVSASREGFVDPAPNGPPQRISLAAGQGITNVSVLLNPQAIVSGKIIDENGDPVPRARVEALTTFSNRGKAQLSRKSAATADDAGEYKLKGLPPGTYYLAAEPASDSKKVAPAECATPEAVRDAAGGQSPPATKETEPSGPELIRTFYPKALDFENAAPIEIGAGQTLAETNIQLRRITTYQVRGKIAASPGIDPGRSLNISLAPRNSLASDVIGRIVPVNHDGTFDIQKVAPGAYTLTLTGLDTRTPPQNARGSSHNRLLARQDIDVTAGDVNGVVLALIPPITLTGRVALDGSDNANLSRVRVNLTPAGGTAVGGFQNVAVNSDGTFNFDSVDPGQYVVRVVGNPPGTYVKSVSFNRQDITGAALDLSQGGSGEIDVVLRSGAGEVDVTVLNPEDQAPATGVPGQPAGSGSLVTVLTPDQLAPDGSGIIFGSASAAGTFVIRNVTPGHYYAFALERWSPVWQNPDFLREMQILGTSIDVEESSRVQIQLPVTAAEQVQQVVARLGLAVQ